jgi:hypothetical protein
MIGARILTQALGEFHSSWGYAAGTPRLPGFLPGTTTFKPFVRTIEGIGRLTIVDTYTKGREAGGFAMVSLNDTPCLLIQYHGGEATRVLDREVQEINDFLKRALANSLHARLPSRIGPSVLYEDDQYGYVGFSIGNIWDLRWGEFIYRRSSRHAIQTLLDEGAERLLNQLMVHGLWEKQGWIVFYHVLTHQRLS